MVRAGKVAAGAAEIGWYLGSWPWRPAAAAPWPWANCGWPRSGRAVRCWLPSAVWAEGLADLGGEPVRVLRGKEVATVLQHHAALHGRVGAA